jgi:hypothetical protein
MLLLLYNYYYFDVLSKYREKLIQQNELITCAYFDDKFGNSKYRIEQGQHSYYNKYSTFIPYGDDDKIYHLDDFRVFKFVGMKDNRKLKLERLMNIDET